MSLFWQLPIPGPPGMQRWGQAGTQGSTGPVLACCLNGEITLDQQQVWKIEETASLIFP